MSKIDTLAAKKTPVAVDGDTHGADYITTIGKNLMPPYREDDILLIHDQPDVLEGEIGIFLIGGKPHLKLRGKSVLLSFKEDVPPVPITDDIEAIGKVVGVIKKGKTSPLNKYVEKGVPYES